MRVIGFVYMLVLVFSCHVVNASPVKEKRDVSSFNKINASSGIDVRFTQGNTLSVEVEADTDVLSSIITTVSANTLTIKKEKSFKGRSLKMTVYITAPSLEELTLSGGSDFYLDHLDTDRLTINSSGGADSEIGSLKVKSTFAINSSGGSDCDISKLEAQDCELRSSGGSDVDISGLKAANVKVNASGGSDMKLKGEVKNLNINVSGGADVHIKELKYDHIISNQKK